MTPPTEPVTFRLTPEEIEILDELVMSQGGNRSQVVRQLLRDGRERYSTVTEACLVEDLLNRYGPGAVLTVTIDLDSFADWRAPVVYGLEGSVLGETPDAPPFDQVAMLHHELDDRERLTIELGALSLPGRVYVGTVPLRRSATLSVKLIDLHPAVANVETLADGRRTVEFTRPNAGFRLLVEREDGSWYFGAEGSPAAFVEDE